MSGFYGHRISGERLAAALEAGRESSPARVPCRPALSRAQLAVAALLSRGFTHSEIALRLGCKRVTVRFFIEEAAQRIPGNLPASAKLTVWYRGAPRDVLGPDPA